MDKSDLVANSGANGVASNGGGQPGDVATTPLKLSYSESDADHSGQSLNKEPKCATFTDGPPTWARVMAHGVIKLDCSIAILVQDAIDYFLSKPDAEKVGVTLESTSAFTKKLFFLFASLKREPKGEIAKVTSAKTMDISEFLDFFYNVALFIKVMGNGQFSPAARQQRLALRDQLQANFLANVSSDPRWQCCKCKNKNTEALERCGGSCQPRHERCKDCIIV